MKSAVDVSKKNMCCYCGSCVSLCPNNTLQCSNGCISYKKNAVCTSCGLCLAVCPSLNDLQKTSVLECYSAYSQCNDIRFNASSGGFITQFLIDLLENGTIDGAIVCDYVNNAFTPQSVVARSINEIAKASASKYCPVPMNLVLSELTTGRYAFVGLPCHIKALRLFQNHNRQIRYSIIIAIGLFCNHTPQYRATDYLLYNYKIKKRDVIKIQYRGDGWPGSMRIFQKNGKIIKILNVWETGFGKFFIPPACRRCRDVFSEHADISVGDPWLKEYSTDTLGTSLVIARTAAAVQLIKTSSNIVINSIGYDKVLESQKKLYSIKVNGKMAVRRRIYFILGKFRILWRLLFLLQKFSGRS